MKQRHHEGLPPGMKRFSILYELPYWTSLRINHLLDPMHIFKNVGSLLWDHITGRKDSHGARADLQEVGIMEELWPVTRADGRITLPKVLGYYQRLRSVVQSAKWSQIARLAQDVSGTSRGCHFRVDHIDKKRVTFDSSVMAKFEQASRRRATDQNIVIAEMQYFGLLKEIINADYRSFTILIFDVQWFKVIMEGPNATVRRDVSGFIEVDSTKPWSDLRDTFVLPEHCEQVIFYPKPSDERWWYVIKVAPRGARIYENYNLITIADAEPIETEVVELPDIDMTMPEDDVEPIEIEVAEMPEDDIVDLNDIDFSLSGELTVDLEVGIELCQNAVENT
ncbi:hypothetical protein L7F22_041546 [Adiantum nelumboides]|nr:hypothetical protein [Adiantum nelumboides]